MSKISTINLVSLTKGRTYRTIIILITAWLVTMAVPVACNAGSSQPTQAPSSVTALPADTSAINGATLLDTRCSVCHSADRPRKAMKTREQWEKIVTSMIAKGAKLNDAEKTVLVDYLAKSYGK